jgi:hypothetical protein
MRPVAVLTAFLALAPFTSVIAQEPPPVQSGARVRVTAPRLGMSKQPATFQAIRGDTLVVLADSTLHCPVEFVSELEVYRGRKSNSLLGAVIGAGAGLVWATYRATEECPGPLCEEQIALGSMFCAGGGAIIGSLIGLAIRTDRWEEVPLSRLRVSLAPQRNGRLGFGLEVRF